MRVFFGALVLNFMLFLDELEASDSRRTLPRPSRNDRQGVPQQALNLGGQQSYYPQSYYPQPFYPQTPGYQAHSQESLHQGSSTGAGNNYFTNLLNAQIEAAKHGNRVDSLDTSRLTKLPARMRDSSSRRQEALDLHQSQPVIQEPPQETREEEVSRLAKMYKKKNRKFSYGASSTSTTNDNPIGYQAQGHPGGENTNWSSPQSQFEAASQSLPSSGMNQAHQVQQHPPVFQLDGSVGWMVKHFGDTAHSSVQTPEATLYLKMQKQWKRKVDYDNMAQARAARGLSTPPNPYDHLDHSGVPGSGSQY